MKLLESFLALVTVLFFASTGVLALVWVGIIGVSALTPSQQVPVATATVAIDAEAPAETTDAAAAPSAAPDPVADPVTPEPAAVLVSAEAGGKVFRKCQACHDASADGRDKTGPNLWGVVGGEIAASADFKYSDAMQARAGEAWSPDLLKAYLAKPNDAVPGTSMSFVGLKKDADVLNVIAYLGQQSPAPQSPADLGLVAGDAPVPASADMETSAAEAPEIEYDEVPWPEGVTYANAPERSEAERQAVAEAVAALEALVPTLDYERARYHELHFPPAIETASNEECLVCHQEILSHEPRAVSPAGVPIDATLAWYQTLDTYEGPQASFHYRHLESDYAKTVMNLECTFCHKGNDPREESPDMIPTRANFEAGASPEFTLRKMVNPTETCLLCHGAFPGPEEIMGLGGPWHEVRVDMEWPEAPNGCMSCHAETYRTVRHNVDYLHARNIEEYARAGSSDSCYGCHGGRAWYRTSYPYPRHEWPLMEDMVGPEAPDWAIGRPTASDPEHALPSAAE